MSSAQKTIERDGLIDIIDDREFPPPGSGGAPSWRVLIVDDEKDVHSATLFALSGLTLVGRPLEFLHAYSAAEARFIIETTPQIAVVLLDVVMESGDAGLRLVHQIRNDLARSDIRIILRTGQPGYAPEMEVIRDYDINDYKTKSELTRTKLVTSITTAIRSYEQLRTIIESRQKLDKIVHSSADLFARRNLADYATGVLRQAASLLDIEPHGLFCAHGDVEAVEADSGSCIVAGALGRHAQEQGRSADAIRDPLMQSLLQGCCETRASVFLPGGCALYIGSGEDGLAVICLETPRELNELERQMLEVLNVGIGVGLENVTLFQRLNALAFFDPLCHLPNRPNFITLIDEQLQRGRAGWSVALIDIDHFADINAALGHKTGDQLLVAMAKRLRGGLADEVAVARVSGGTFALLGPDAAIEPMRILALFAQPIVVEGQSLMIQPWIGMESLSEVEDPGAEIFKNANIALSRARTESSKRWMSYTRDMRVATRHRLGLLHDLRHAAEAKRGLSMYYQPMIDMATKRVIGAEALMRWKNERGENIPPDHFIPLAEYSHLIIELGEWALRTACRQLKAWHQLGYPEMRMAVNVSLAQFRDPNFVAKARCCIEEFGVNPKLIELEITESQALQETVAVIEALHQLKDMGVSIAIDDFGSGFSSLNHLHRLPINRLKIDRAFVTDLSAGHSSSGIADMIVKLSRMLGLSVIAEGVETSDQFDALRGMGCQEVQGFFFSPPVPAESFESYLRQSPK